MKWLVIILLLTTSPTWAAENELLKCLGREEKQFHLKKQLGPAYDLNQRLIGEMVQIPSVEVTPEYMKLICGPDSFSPSWRLLEYSIKKGKTIFNIAPSITGMQREIALGMIADYLEASREILINFISAIQAASPSATCLKEEIPELNDFFVEIKYLQEDVDLSAIFLGKDQKIFNRLKDYPKAFERCRERLKKKPKPASVPEAKKP